VNEYKVHNNSLQQAICNMWKSSIRLQHAGVFYKEYTNYDKIYGQHTIRRFELGIEGKKGVVAKIKYGGPDVTFVRRVHSRSLVFKGTRYGFFGLT